MINEIVTALGYFFIFFKKKDLMSSALEHVQAPRLVGFSLMPAYQPSKTRKKTEKFQVSFDVAEGRGEGVDGR